MPNQTGGFATGLAKGLFGALTSQRQKREEDNNRQKGETLKLLTGLLPSVEPQSQGALLRHIGDVMGLKGKQQGFWASLTGADQRGDSEALQSKLSEIMGTIKGPEDFKRDSPRAVPGFASGGGFGPAGAVPTPYKAGMTPDNRGNNIYLNDPQADKLEQLAQRYDNRLRGMTQDYEGRLKLASQLRTEEEEKRQQNRLERDAKLYENKLMEDINGAALQFGGMRTGGAITPEQLTNGDKAAAIDYLYQNDQTKARTLKAKLGLIGAQTDLAVAQSTFAKNNQGLKPNEAASGARADRREARMQQDSDNRRKDIVAKVGLDYSTAQANAKASGAAITELSNAIQAQGYSYDFEKGKLFKKDGTPVSERQMMTIGPMVGLDKLRKAIDHDIKMRGILQGQYNKIKSRYGKDFNVYGNTMWDVDMNPQVPGGDRGMGAQGGGQMRNPVPVAPAPTGTPLPPAGPTRMQFFKPTPTPPITQAPPNRPSAPAGATKADRVMNPQGGRIFAGAPRATNKKWIPGPGQINKSYDPGPNSEVKAVGDEFTIGPRKLVVIGINPDNTLILKGLK